jgi:heptosyltransferase-2/heptosyltransferase-3
MGDMVMLTPLLRLLAARYGRKVDLISSGAWTLPLLQHEPALGELHLLTSRNAPYWLNASQRAVVRWLKQRGCGPVYFCDEYDAALKLLRRAAIPETDTVPLAAGDAQSADDSRLWPDRWLRMGMQSPPAFPASHVVNPQPFRQPALVVTEDEREQCATWLQQRGFNDRPLVLFQPGNKRTHKRGKVLTANHSKHWPAENWAAVANAIVQTLPQAQVLLCGSPAEASVLQDIKHASASAHVHNLAGELPIPRLLALLQCAHSMVSVDTGPAHAAAALGCPLVVLFGSAPVAQWRPLGTAPVITLGGERGADSQVKDIAATTVMAAWRGLQATAK